MRRKATVRRRRRRAARLRPREAETRLLRLASELTRLARGPRPPREALGEALAQLSADATDRRGAVDKAARLALAWAQEQVRLALEEVLERAARAGAARADVPPATLAWLVLGACQTLGDQAPDAIPDRLTALAAFIRPGGLPG